MKRHARSLCLCLSALCTQASAQQVSDGAAAYRMDTVVVTGTRTEKVLSDSPVRTEVVDAQEIEQTHARDLSEALEDVPGLQLRKIIGKSGNQVWLQGLDGDRVLVLIDGQAVPASTNSTADLSQIGTSDIERIEIVKGATSALYGSSAMGGVVNVITRQPDRPFGYRLQLDGGTYAAHNTDGGSGLLHLAGRVQRMAERYHWQLSTDVRSSDGFDLDTDTFTTEGDAGEKINLDARLGWTPDATNEWYIAPAYYQEDLEHRFTTPAPGQPDGVTRKLKLEAAARSHISLGGNHQPAGDQLAWSVAHDSWRDTTQQDALATVEVDQERRARFDQSRFEMQWDRAVGEWQLLTAGVLLGREELRQTKRESGTTLAEVPDASRTNAEVYLQDDLFLSETWELVPGLRLQQDSDFGDFLAPKINLMAGFWRDEPVQGRLRIGYGRGYRVPNLKERFFEFDHSTLGYQVLGNPDLQPEQSDSLQLGIEFFANTRWRFDLNLFRNEIRDLIDTDIDSVTADGIRLFRFQNVARARTQGAELTGSLGVGSSLRVGFSYLRLEARDLDTNQVLAQRPEDQIKLSLDWQVGPWETLVSLRGTHQSEEFVDSANSLVSPAWTSWDLKLNQPLSPRFRIFAGIDNLSDEHRNPDTETEDQRPLSPRFIYAGLRIDG